VSNVRSGRQSSGTDVVWRAASSASDKQITRIGRWKAFRSLGSRGVGAPRVEEALAVRANSGQPATDWRVKEAPVVELSRPVQGLTTPAWVHVSRKLEFIPRGGGFEATAGEIGTKPIRYSRLVTPATASQRRRGQRVSRPVQACRVRGSGRPRGSEE